MSSELERSYRRWLRVYPASYRRERGLEMITTLMEAAGPGQTRPSRVEVAYLLLMGLKFRFVAPTWTGRVAAGLVAIWAAVVLSGAGALAVWATADPQKPDLTAVSDSLAGQAASETYQVPGGSLLEMTIGYRTSSEFGNFAREGWDGVLPAPMGEIRRYSRSGSVVTGMHQRLAAEGWRTGAIRTTAQYGNVDRRIFWAERDGEMLRVAAHPDGTLEIGAFPAEPGGVFAGAVTGAVIGLVLTWQAVTLLAHRAARTSRPARWLIRPAGLAASAAAAVNTLDNVLSVGPDVDALLGNIEPSGQVFLGADLLYPLANQVENPLAVLIIGLSAVACAGILAAERRSRAVLTGAAVSG